MRENKFHSIPINDLKSHFEVDLSTGLSDEKASRLLRQYGENTLSREKENFLWVIIYRQFANFFILLLILAGIISYFVDGPSQMFVLFAIVLVNVALGFFQEYKAEKALLALKKSFIAKSRVVREGSVRVVESEVLVPGDLVLLEAGDRVPADLRLFEEESLRIDESALTGESLPIGKHTKSLPEDTLLADRRNIAFCSTVVVAGHGRGITIATGKETEFGKIATLIEKPEEKTPLEIQVAYVGKSMTVLALLSALIIFVLGLYRQVPVWELLTFSVALMVAVVPESLPTAITSALAVGVSRMAKKNAITKRLSVVETLGTTNVIVADKTGTLTGNNLSVGAISSYSEGKLISLDLQKNNWPEVENILTYALDCSNVDLNGESYSGDPLEVAIADKINKAGKIIEYKENQKKRLMEIPFDSDKKFMAVLLQDELMIIKGMPEKIINFSKLSQGERDAALAESHRLAREGYKVIAVATKTVSKLTNEVLNNVKFLGLIGLVDEPSDGVKYSIAQALKAGIRIIILTGDHPETARFVAQKIGLNIKQDELVGGEKLERISDDKLKELLLSAKVFARVSPEDKTRVVRLLKEMGNSVAVTGDGVNDAPALKEAQAGIAMGIRGTDVAKEAADLVLADDKFSTIISAILYGRTIFDNIKNTIVFLVAGNMNELIIVAFAFLIGMPTPLTALQILWINLVTDSMPALALSFESPSSRTLVQKPRPISITSLRAPLYYSIALSLVSLVLTLVIYLWGLNFSLAKASTLVFSYLVLIELVYAFSVRSSRRIWQEPKLFFHNKFLLVSIVFSLVLLVAAFFIPSVFGLVSLSLGEVGLLIIFAILAFSFAEVLRYFFDKKQ